jgi:Haem-binding domain
VIRRERCLSEIANQVQDGGMPLAGYTFLHRDAKLSKEDVEAVFKWTQEERARLIMENASGKTSP